MAPIQSTRRSSGAKVSKPDRPPATGPLFTDARGKWAKKRGAAFSRSQIHRLVGGFYESLLGVKGLSVVSILLSELRLVLCPSHLSVS